MKKLTVGIIGFDHIHARQFRDSFLRHPEQYDILGCADVPAKDGSYPEDSEVRRLRNLGGDFGTLYANYRDLLDLRPDVVAVCSTISRYPDMAEECCARGIVSVVEKPMAVSLKDAMRMYRSSEGYGVPLFVKWPIIWCRAFERVRELIREGAVGRVLRIQYRSPATLGPHSGRYTPEERRKMWWFHRELGGGSIMDYAGYGHALLTYLLGKPALREFGISKNFMMPYSDAEDYSAFLMDFGDCVGWVEGSWSTVNSGEIPTGPVVYGSDGVLVADRFSPEVKLYRRFDHKFTPPDAVYTVDADDFPDIADDLYRHLVHGHPVSELMLRDFNLTVMAELDAGIRSLSTGAAEPVSIPETGSGTR